MVGQAAYISEGSEKIHVDGKHLGFSIPLSELSFITDLDMKNL